MCNYRLSSCIASPHPTIMHIFCNCALLPHAHVLKLHGGKCNNNYYLLVLRVTIIKARSKDASTYSYYLTDGMHRLMLYRHRHGINITIKETLTVSHIILGGHEKVIEVVTKCKRNNRLIIMHSDLSIEAHNNIIMMLSWFDTCRILESIELPCE